MVCGTKAYVNCPELAFAVLSRRFVMGVEQTCSPWNIEPCDDAKEAEVQRIQKVAPADKEKVIKLRGKSELDVDEVNKIDGDAKASKA